ncbi:MAG: 16S rRNA (cytosine(1402)-N(4))-methyltransferase RsmH [Desulfobacterales bacterium]|jgi:16S rRNA (cytosine1402-N4)-methyltransferase|nr:16S rRNA (cytosine(1402)-N(4))-methyltransferase RsmH [Desulfobacterales bacterium]
MAYRHVPVMRREVLAYLDCRPGQTVVDGTLGGAGHAREICERIGPGGRLIGIDQDPEAVAHARSVLAPFGERVQLVQENFANMAEVLSRLGVGGADGILLDLGLSLNQLENSGRGFSFQREEPLDMRMDPRTGESAAELIARLEERELERIFRDFGEERHARAIARRLAAEQRRRPVRTSAELSRIVCAAVPRANAGRSRIHPATRVFMALRIAVNRELERLEAFLEALPRPLNPGGRVCILSFHSLEDRMVKQQFKALAQEPRRDPWPGEPATQPGGTLRVLTRKVVRPGPDEVAQNPMARSTRLRAAERLR